jgi:LacI family transcriptional regulator
VQSPNNQKDITIRDLAVMLGLSSATISRALNNDIVVSKKTRNRVFDLAEKLGYRVNEHAKLLRNGRSNTIGCIVPKLDHYLWSSVVAGIENAARREEYSVIVMQSEGDRELEADCANLLFNKRIDGLLVVSTAIAGDLRHFRSFLQKDVPVVLLDRYGDDEGFIKLNIDNRTAGYEMTRHLLGQGRKKIVHITSDTPLPAYLQRYEGYKKALEEAGIAVNQQYIIKCGLRPADGIAVAEMIHGWKQKPDAIFAGSDHCAAACLSALQKKGIRVPKDMAIAGYGNDPVGMATHPTLTTIRYPGRQAGESAVHHLVERLNCASASKLLDTIVLKSELVIRESSQSIDC